MNLKRPVAAFLLATTPACMATRRVVPQQYLAQNRPAQMLVMDDEGALHVLAEPVIVGDNLVGIEAGTPDTLSLPVSQVTEAMVREKSPLRTAFLVGGLTAGTSLALVAILTGGSGASCKLGSNDSRVGPAQCDAGGADGTGGTGAGPGN